VKQSGGCKQFQNARQRNQKLRVRQSWGNHRDKVLAPAVEVCRTSEGEHGREAAAQAGVPGPKDPDASCAGGTNSERDGQEGDEWGHDASFLAAEKS
jgi:hypothetical protein